MINELSHVAKYKINIQKLVAFLYTNNELSERETNKTISFTIALKILRNKFNQKILKVYTQKCIRHFKKQIEEDINKWKHKLCS